MNPCVGTTRGRPSSCCAEPLIGNEAERFAQTGGGVADPQPDGRRGRVGGGAAADGGSEQREPGNECFPRSARSGAQVAQMFGLTPPTPFRAAPAPIGLTRAAQIVTRHPFTTRTTYTCPCPDVGPESQSRWVVVMNCCASDGSNSQLDECIPPNRIELAKTIQRVPTSISFLVVSGFSGDPW